MEIRMGWVIFYFVEVKWHDTMQTATNEVNKHRNIRRAKNWHSEI